MNSRGELNRSVRNTKKRLRESLLRLVARKPLRLVTVKEITQDADVNRSTFYFHYQDVNAMVREMEENFFRDFTCALDAIEQKSHDSITILVKCLEAHMDLCRIVLGRNGDMSFAEKMKEIVAQKCSTIWMEAVPGMDEHAADMLDEFLIGGVFSTLQAWVRDENRESAEQLSEVLNRLIFDGICPVVAMWQTQGV